MLTRKDFESLAHAISTLEITPNDHGMVVSLVSDWCATQNPRFDRERFRSACKRGRAVPIDEGGTICGDCGCDSWSRAHGGLICRQCGSFYAVACPDCHKQISDTGECECDFE